MMLIARRHWPACYGNPRWVRRFLALALFIAIIGASGAGFASSDDAAQFIQRLGNRTIETLQATDLTLDQRESRLRSLLSQDFDLPFIGRFVLGKYWRLATAEQHGVYLSLFSEFVLQTYSSRLSDFASATMTVVGARQASEKDVVVRMKIQQPSGFSMFADWRVRTTESRYRIIDVMVNGVSMALTHRSEVASIVRRNGIDGLLMVLRTRTARTRAAASLF